MKVGDLVRMDFEDPSEALEKDNWGIGLIVTVDNRDPDDVEVFWPNVGLSWEMKIMLEKIDESR